MGPFLLMEVPMSKKKLKDRIAGIFLGFLSTIESFASIDPVKLFHRLLNREDPLSSLHFVNLLWGAGSFILFWVEHFLRIYRNLDYKFTAADYVFIAGMAGISSLSAFASNNNSHAPTDPPKPPPPTTTPPKVGPTGSSH